MIPSQALAAVTASELARAATMFTTIKQLRLRVSEIDESILDNAFETHVQSVLEKLDERLPQIEDSSVREAEVLMAKHGLFDAGFQQAILLCHTVFPALGDSLKDIRSVHSSFVSEFYRVIDDSQHTFAEMSDQIQRQQEEIEQLKNEKSTHVSRNKVLDKEAEELRLYIEDLRQELREANNELNVQRETLKYLSKNPPNQSTHSSQNDYGLKPFVFSMEDMSSPSGSHPNRKSVTPGNKVSSSNNTNNSTNSTPRIPSTSKLNTINNSNSNSATDLMMQSKSFPLMVPLKSKYTFVRHQPTWLYNFRSEMQQCIDTGKCRELSIKECKDMIEKLYDSKATANDKASKGLSNYPPETMEQHVYRIFEKKYGLRTLAVEQAGKLFMAIQSHHSDDNYITVFYKIFKNEIEEDFRLVQQELLRSIYDLIMIQLVARFPTKDQTTLQQLFDKKTKSTISEDEWTDMMNYLYDENDSIAICMILKREARREIEDTLQEQHKNHLANSPVSQFVHEQLGHDRNYNVTSNMAVANFSHEDDGLSFLSTPTNRPISPQSTFSERAVMVKNITKINPSLTSQGIIHPPANLKDSKRLGYKSSSIKAASKAAEVGLPWKEIRQEPNSPSSINSVNQKFSFSNSKALKNDMSQSIPNNNSKNTKKSKSNLRLSFELFVKSVLDFQLHSHERYLLHYREIFHGIDEDCDGILNIRDFYKCYSIIRSKQFQIHDHQLSNPMLSAGEELETFASIVRLIDPMETDIITFSASATALSKVGMKMGISELENPIE